MSIPSGEKACKMSASYAEGSSWTSYQARDVAYPGGPHDHGLLLDEKDTVDGADPEAAVDYSFPLNFGCQYHLTGLFKTQLADGIMGMDNADSAFWMQMHSAGAIQEKEFSMCFNRQIDVARNGTIAGALTLGGTDPRLHLSPIVWSDNVRATGFYTVRLRKMYLREGGGVSAEYDPDMNVHPIAVNENTLNYGGVIVDSGTTDTYMTRKIGAVFKSAWSAITGKNYSQTPVKLTDEQLDALPTILFQIAAKAGMENGDPSTTVGLAGGLDGDHPADIVIAMPASHYMEYDPEDDAYTPRLYLDEGSGSVLGANVMMGHDVVFDVAGQKIGWAESNCDYDLLLDEGLSIDKRKNKMAKTEDMVVLGDEEKCKGVRCKIGVIVGAFSAFLLTFLSWRRFRNHSEKPKLVPMESMQYRDENELEAGNEIEVTSSIGLVERQEGSLDHVMA